jgi:hypothetical protein
MSPSSNSEMDEAILSVTETSWRKVALVIAKAESILGDNLPQGEAGLNLVAERIEVLVQDGRLLAQGDTTKWRHSEVRKPDFAAANSN